MLLLHALLNMFRVNPSVLENVEKIKITDRLQKYADILSWISRYTARTLKRVWQHYSKYGLIDMSDRVRRSKLFSTTQ